MCRNTIRGCTPFCNEEKDTKKCNMSNSMLEVGIVESAKRIGVFMLDTADKLELVDIFCYFGVVLQHRKFRQHFNVSRIF